jgi:hypothetical protein
MTHKWAVGTVVALLVTLVAGTSAWAQDPAADEATKELASVAIRRAAKADKYIFLLFYRADDEATRAARKTFDAAVEKLAERALSAIVNVADPLEQAVVAQYGVNRSPMPLVLALAPNGAVTRSFVGSVVDAQLEAAFVSPATAQSLKALQGRKLVFICVQNGKTQHNDEALAGVKALAAEPQYAKLTEIITLDPTDAAEAGFLKQLKVDPQTEEAVTVFMAPPGTTVGTYTGATEKDVLMAAAKKAATACDPKSGCCAPKKPASPQPPPQQGSQVRPQPQQPPTPGAKKQ